MVERSDLQKLIPSVASELKEYDYIVYADGASRGNPGPAGIGLVIITRGGKVFSAQRSFGEATNNQMELKSIIESLKCLEDEKKVLIRTDSQYVAKAFSENWVETWKKSNWKKKDKTEVKNKDLWKELLFELKKKRVFFEWIRGHHEDKFNLEVDRLAVAAAKSSANKLHQV
ncbi:MAG: ribonuclease HI [Deltaproteobacteria bacterium]|nr:ribonuclease HI [Deltaproteobacteria bacterium]